MLAVSVPDIGDGLAIGIWTIGGQRVQIDCGSQQYADRALHKGFYGFTTNALLSSLFPMAHDTPNVFFLSHFHTDHYNGLLHWYDYNQPGRIEKVFLPRLPKFEEREEFILCMVTMAHWIMGDRTGSMDADFLSLISKINSGQPFTYEMLANGDVAQVGSSRFEVLWPPRTIEEDATLSVIRKAISDFNHASDKDDDLRRIRDIIKERGEIEDYLISELEINKIQRRSRELNKEESRELRQEKEKIKPQLSKEVKKANDSLRSAANHLSLALHQDNKFLFLGDLEGHEIEQVVQFLQKKGLRDFVIMITPHHGTHWQKDLDYINSLWVVSSVGRRLYRYVSPNFNSLSHVHLITHHIGDISIPVIHHPWNCYVSWLQWWRYFRQLKE